MAKKDSKTVEMLNSNRVMGGVFLTLYDLGYHVQAKYTDDGVMVLTYFLNPPDFEGKTPLEFPPIRITGEKIVIPKGSPELIVQTILGV